MSTATDINGTALAINDQVVVLFGEVAAIPEDGVVMLRMPDGKLIAANGNRLEKRTQSHAAERTAIDGAVAAVQTAVTAMLLPIGAIVLLLDGTDVPGGWAIADGNSGTIDLSASTIAGTNYIQRIA